MIGVNKVLESRVICWNLIYFAGAEDLAAENRMVLLRRMVVVLRVRAE